MNKNDKATLGWLGIGAVGTIVGLILHRKAKKIDEELEQSLKDTEEYIQRSYAGVINQARAVDAIGPDEETAKKLEKIFGNVTKEQS